MPSRAMPAMSGVLLMTTLWPVAVAGSLPGWASSTVMVGQLAETVGSFRSNFIASSPLREMVQLPAAWAMPAAPSRARAARMRVRFFMVLLRDGRGGWKASVRGKEGADLLQECGIGGNASDFGTRDIPAFRVPQHKHAGVVADADHDRK